MNNARALKASTLKNLSNGVIGAHQCLFTFPTKVLNICNFRINVTPKVGVHLGIIGLHPLHSSPFVRVCFMGLYTSHLVTNPMLEWYEKNKLDVNLNMSNQDEGDFEGNTMDDFNEHEIGGMHGNNINDIFGDANKNFLELGQGDQKPYDPYTFVDKKEFNVRPRVEGNVAFVQLLIKKGYWKV